MSVQCEAQHPALEEKMVVEKKIRVFCKLKILIKIIDFRAEPNIFGGGGVKIKLKKKSFFKNDVIKLPKEV